MELVLGIVKASLEILGIGIGVKKVVLLMSVAKHKKGLLVDFCSYEKQKRNRSPKC